jgi:hypothetical protein
MHHTQLWQIIVIALVAGYVAVCFGLVAKRNGRNPWIWGLLSIISPANLFILGYWAARRKLPFGGN